MKNENNVRGLPNANINNANAEAMLRLVPDVIADIVPIAQMRYGSYKAHIDAGFSEDQALKLCVYLSLNP